MSLFTSILKDIAEETIPKTSAVPKRSNKSWFSDICKDAIKERNRALERFKREPTEGNLNAYHIARAKARRDVRLSKKTSWRNYVSKLNSQASVKSVWNRIRKIKGKESSNSIQHLSANNRDVTSHRDIANALADNVSHNSSYALKQQQHTQKATTKTNKNTTTTTTNKQRHNNNNEQTKSSRWTSGSRWLLLRLPIYGVLLCV